MAKMASSDLPTAFQPGSQPGSQPASDRLPTAFQRGVPTPPYTPGGWKPALEGGQPPERSKFLAKSCRTSGVADMVPLATFRKLKAQLREERRLRQQAEADRDAIRTTL